MAVCQAKYHNYFKLLLKLNWYLSKIIFLRSLVLGFRKNMAKFEVKYN